MFHYVLGECLQLLPEKAIWWQSQKALIVADTHLGKAQHFRKAGFAVPKAVFQKDLGVLNELLIRFQPKKFIVVGDMFHSIANSEVHIFEIWRAQYPNVEFILVKGNHDILSDGLYREMGVKVHKLLHLHPFNFSHHLPTDLSKESLCFCGHIHPGVLLKGKGRMKARLPCFYFEKNYALLPAFGNFTGLDIIAPSPNAKVFAIVENTIIEV